jgi:nucleoside-diphosphate-sugar epimerase
VYGIADTSQYATEESPLAPLTAYARAKVAAERDIVSMGDGKFTAVSMRNATMHGVSPRMRLDLVLNNLAASAVADGTVRILSDGTPWRPMLSVDDFAAYVWALLSSPEPRERVYNVGFTAENYQVAALGRMVSDASGAGLEMNAGKTPDERSYKVSFSRAEREFGLKPQKRVAESAAEMVRALAEAGFSRADFESSRFFRIRKIRELVKSGKLDSELRWSV